MGRILDLKVGRTTKRRKHDEDQFKELEMNLICKILGAKLQG